MNRRRQSLDVDPSVTELLRRRQSLSRRSFLRTSAAGAALLGATAARLEGREAAPATEERFRGGRFEPPVVVATWDHGAAVATRAHRALKERKSPLDAVEAGINVAELDPAVDGVGLGGLPNEDGRVELDAAIMEGRRLRCGAVLSLRDFPRPISVARRVFEKTRHIQLVGDGAHEFALDQGFEPANLLTEASRKAWEKWKASPDRRVPGQVNDVDPNESHDTVGAVALAAGGRMVAGCSTSGLSWKMAGRVGDSPIIGAGLYCDDRAGAASATGIGEEVLRVCGSFLVVEAMRRGATPQEAVEEALGRIIAVDPKNRHRQVAFVALDPRGNVGAASILPGFEVAIAADGVNILRETHSLQDD